MFIQLGAGCVGWRQKPSGSAKAVRVESKRHGMVFGGLLGFTFFIFLFLTGLIALAVTIPRIGTAPLIIDIPAAYLPGNVLPSGPAECFEPERDPVSCEVNVSGHQLFLSFRLGTGKILSTAWEPQQITVGDLIASWGTPTGIIPYNPYHSLIEINWENRSAILATSLLQPDASVSLIFYGPLQRATLPWRGFTRRYVLPL